MQTIQFHNTSSPLIILEGTKDGRYGKSSLSDKRNNNVTEENQHINKILQENCWRHRNVQIILRFQTQRVNLQLLTFANQYQ